MIREAGTIDELRARLLAAPLEERVGAAFELAKLGDFCGRDALIEALKADDPAHAANVLGRIGAPWALGPVAALLGHPDTTVRNEAIFALARTSRAAAVPLLLGALADPDPERREDARVALISLVGPGIAGALNATGDEDEGEIERAKAWWEQNRSLYPEAVALRDGEPLSIGDLMAELDRASPEVQSSIIDEIQTFTGAPLPDADPVRQADSLREFWRSRGADFEVGKRYFFGHPVE
jgi:hypothetical protein